jgi:hypothetical protein
MQQTNRLQHLIDFLGAFGAAIEMGIEARASVQGQIPFEIICQVVFHIRMIHFKCPRPRRAPATPSIVRAATGARDEFSI